MKRAFFIVALFLTISAKAEDLSYQPPAETAEIPILKLRNFEFFQKPNTADYVLQITFVLVTTVDWMQTIWFTQNPRWRGHEENSFVGPKPSRARVNTLIPLAILGHTAIAYALPRPWRTFWQLAWITVEVGAVHTNYGLGVKLATPW